MAKFVWWLTVLISCLANSVAPFHMEEVGFLINHYYTSNMGDEESAADIYQRFYTAANQVYQPCNPTVFNTESPRYNNSYKNLNLCNELYYYFLPTTDATIDYKTFSIGDGEKVPIIAPTDMTLITKCTDSKYSTYMELQMGKYTVVITGMEYWYCCWGHTTFDGANYQHMDVTPSDYKNKFSSGDVLGMANKDTRIVIYNGRNAISFSQFYTNSADGEPNYTEWTTALDGTYIPPAPEEE